MTKRDFEQLAAMVKRYTDSARSVGVERLAHDIANIARDNNPRFDITRFYDACGLDTFGGIKR